MRAQPYRRERRIPAVQAAVEATPLCISPQLRGEIQRGGKRESLVPALTAVQKFNEGYLDRAVLGAVADCLETNDGHVYGVASFYSMFSTRPRLAKSLRLCDGPVCRLHGSEAVRETVTGTPSMAGWGVERCSCLGLCDRAPAALQEDEPYGPILPNQPMELLKCPPSGSMLIYGNALPGEVRVSMVRIGRINPESVDSALAQGAYKSLRVALRDSPNKVLDAIDRSGLRGRGGAGFPTGRKWRMVAETTDPEKYIICNADESEPGTFKDRILMEGDPHLLLEGMALAGYAVGANQGFIYIRGEFEWIARRLERAIWQAENRGWLGQHIQGSEFSFQVHVHRGAGAYICGEETALIESLEGKRGQPRSRPPYPTTHGYLGKPTLVNNVETLCLVPPILDRGPDWFKSLGTPNSAGTKVFTLTGHVCRPGALEVPLGLTLRQAIDQFGGGMRPGSKFKAALTGGAAGTFVPASMLDLPLDFDSAKQGVALGSGAIMIFDESVLIPTILTWLLGFFEAESCGKCTPCREGSRELRVLSERLAGGHGRLQDAAELERLAHLINRTSLCGLGQSMAWPVASALRHFADEFARASNTGV